MGLIDDLTTSLTSTARDDLEPAMVLALADDVPIGDVAQRLFGLHWPTGVKSWKSWCPFQFEHGDTDRNFRVYPGTNSAYCFEVHGYLSVVGMASQHWGESRYRAGLRLLDEFEVGWRPRPWSERWPDLADKPTDVGAPEYAVQALQESLSRDPDYVRLAYTVDTMQAMSEALEQLPDALLEEHHRDGALEDWLHQSRQRVLASVKEHNNDP